MDAVSRHGVRPAYLNFVENLTDVRRAFDPLTWRQLVGIKSAIDPNSVFVANHPIPTLFEDGAPTTRDGPRNDGLRRGPPDLARHPLRPPTRAMAPQRPRV